MPIYEYKCRLCEEVQAITRYIKDRNKDTKCIKCEGEATLIASICGLITVSS